MGLVPGTGEALWDLWVLEGLSGLCLKERGVDPPRTGWATLSLARGEPATPASSPPAQAQQAANSCFRFLTRVGRHHLVAVLAGMGATRPAARGLEWICPLC